MAGSLEGAVLDERMAVMDGVRAQYKQLWAHGIMHGDVAWRHVAQLPDGRVMLLDLDFAQLLSPEAAEHLERPLVERLLR